VHILYVHPRPVQDPYAPEWSGVQVAQAIRRTSRHTAHTLLAEDFLENSDNAVELCSGADVIVLPGDLLPVAHTAIQRWKARDKILVADLDDLSSEMSPNGKGKLHIASLAEAGKEQSALFLPATKLSTTGIKPSPAPVGRAGCPTTEELFRWGLRLTHGATSSSHSLVEGWRTVTNTRFLPAYIDLDTYVSLGIQPHPGVVIGLAGRGSLASELETYGVLEVLERLCHRREDIRLMVIGCAAGGGMENGFPHLTPLLYDRLWNVFPGTTRAQRLAQVDIGLIFGPNRPSHAARDILELMAMKIPWVSIESPDLYDWRRFGWLVEPNPRMWDWILNDMVDQLPAYQKEASGEPYLFALSRGISENIEKIVSVYASIQAQASFGEV